MAYNTNTKSNAGKHLPLCRHKYDYFDMHCITKSKNASKTKPLSQQKQLHHKRIFDPRTEAHSSTVFNVSLFRDTLSHIYKVFYKEKPSNDRT